MTLPASRNTNYSPGATAVRAADLNDIQDAIIGGKHGDLPFHVPLIIYSASNWSATVQAGLQAYLSSSGSGACYVWIPSVSGKRIKSVTFASQSAAGTEDFNQVVVHKLFKDATASSPIGTLATPSNIPTTWTDFTIDVTDTVVADNFDFVIQFDAAVANLRVKNIRATFDAP
jgi:hypothetical protein